MTKRKYISWANKRHENDFSTVIINDNCRITLNDLDGWAQN